MFFFSPLGIYPAGGKVNFFKRLILFPVSLGMLGIILFSSFGVLVNYPAEFLREIIPKERSSYGV